MAGAVGSGPKDALQAGVVVCLYVLGMIAAGSLFLVMARACYSSWGLCRQPLPPRYGKMDAQAATDRRRQEKARKGAAAEARRARDARGEEPSPLPSPSGSTLGSAEVAGYDLEAGGVVGEETKAPDGAGPGRRSFGGNDQSDARDYAPGRGMGSIAVNGASGGGGVVGQPQGQGLPSPARFSSARLPPPPRRRWALLFHHAAADGTEAGGGRLVAPIPRRPHRNPPAPALTPLGLPTLVQGVGAAAAAPSSSALPAALSDASPSGSASRSRSGYGSTTRPGARAVGDGDGFGVRRGVTMAVP